MELWRTSTFATKGMRCLDCEKTVQVDTSKRSQCPDCFSLRVVDTEVNTRSKSQAPRPVASRQRRVAQAAPSRVHHSQAQRPSNVAQPDQRPALRRAQPREEAKRPGLRPSRPAPNSTNVRRAVRPERANPSEQAAPQRNREAPQAAREVPHHAREAPRPAREAPQPVRPRQSHEPYPIPRPMIPEYAEDLEDESIDVLPPTRRLRMIRLSSPLEALELFRFLPQRQAAVLFFIMQGLGLFGVPSFEDEDGTASSFEEFLGRLISVQPSRVHPASSEYLQRMESAKVTAAMELKGEVCTVCLSPLKVGEYANRLPCKHIFHGECLMPWLRTNNTCPVCRQEVDRK